MPMNGNGSWTGQGHFDGYVPEGGQRFLFGQGQLQEGVQSANQENYPGNSFRGNPLTTSLNSYNFVFVQPGDYQVNVSFSNRGRTSQPQSILPHGQSDQIQESSRQSSHHCPIHGESGYDVCGRMPFGENNEFNPVLEAFRPPDVIRTPSTDRFHSCETLASGTGGARGTAGLKSFNHSVSEQDSGYSPSPLDQSSNFLFPVLNNDGRLSGIGDCDGRSSLSDLRCRQSQPSNRSSPEPSRMSNFHNPIGEAIRGVVPALSLTAILVYALLFAWVIIARYLICRSEPYPHNQ